MQSPERGAKLTVMGLVRALAFDDNRAHKGHLAQARLPLNPSPQQRLFSVDEGWADGFLTRRSWVRLPLEAFFLPAVAHALRRFTC